MKIADTITINFDGNYTGVVTDISPCNGFSITNGSSHLVVPMRIKNRRLRRKVILNNSPTLIKGK